MKAGQHRLGPAVAMVFAVAGHVPGASRDPAVAPARCGRGEESPGADTRSGFRRCRFGRWKAGRSVAAVAPAWPRWQLPGSASLPAEDGPVSAWLPSPPLGRGGRSVADGRVVTCSQIKSFTPPRICGCVRVVTCRPRNSLQLPSLQSSGLVQGWSWREEPLWFGSGLVRVANAGCSNPRVYAVLGFLGNLTGHACHEGFHLKVWGGTASA